MESLRGRSDRLAIVSRPDVQVSGSSQIAEVHRSFMAAIASLVIGLLLASTAFGLARPFADFLVGRSLPLSLLKELLTIVESDAAIEQVLPFRAIYSGPEEVLVMAKIHPTAHINSEEFGRAMDALDHKIRLAFPVVADVFIDITANQIKDAPPSR